MKPKLHVVPIDGSIGNPANCRRPLIGPGVNQPDPFPGYGGFVGWESVIRLKNGTMLLGFSAGYWHVSVPTPSPQIPNAVWANYRRLGIPDIHAPRGGRIMICRSTDQGSTWSKPQTLIDTTGDDRHPCFCQLDDGTIICSFFTAYPKDSEHSYMAGVTRSSDGGETWTQPCYIFPGGGIHAPPIRLSDASVMLCAYPARKEIDSPELFAKTEPRRAFFLRSQDSGRTWSTLSSAQTDHDLVEPAIAQLSDGRIVCVARNHGDVFWSDDSGLTWTHPCPVGISLFAPGLVPLADGTLVCISGSNAKKSPHKLWGLQCIFSTDRGQTWIAPAPDRGFSIDSEAYGYGKGCELPDGSIYVVYIKYAGHNREEAATNAVLALRFRILPDKDGIEILPASG